MGFSDGAGPGLPRVIARLHAEEIFSYGISDNTDGISLYAPGRRPASS